MVLLLSPASFSWPLPLPPAPCSFPLLLLLPLLLLHNSAASDCCEHLLLDDSGPDQSLHPSLGNRLGFFSKLGEYGARPAYRQMSGDIFLFYSEEEKKWVDTKFFFGATLFNRLENKVESYCLEDFGAWSFYNNSQMQFTENLHVNCSRIEEVCCHQVEIVSSNSGNSSYYGEELVGATSSLGLYTSIGTQHGRYLYQKEGSDSFLEYGDRYWLVSTGVGKTSGHINHLGGSVCPEHISGGWQVSTQDSSGSWDWQADPGLNINCVKAPDHKGHVVRRPHHLGGQEVAEHLLVKEEGGLLEHTAALPQTGPQSQVSSSTVLGLLLCLLLVLMTVFFVKRFHKAWGRGAQGKRLLTETFVE